MVTKALLALSNEVNNFMVISMACVVLVLEVFIVAENRFSDNLCPLVVMKGLRGIFEVFIVGVVVGFMNTDVVAGFKEMKDFVVSKRF